MNENNDCLEFGQMTELDGRHVPDVNLCRFFSKQKYADSFGEGQYRFVDLKEYKKSGYDVRSDPTERESANDSSDGSSHSGSSFNSCFAMCFTELDSYTDVPLLKKKFGSEGNEASFLRIENNLELTRKIQAAWKKSSVGNGIACFRWFKVIYNKFEVVENFDPNVDLDVYQKPRKHVIHRLKVSDQTTPFYPFRASDSKLWFFTVGSPHAKQLPSLQCYRMAADYG